MEPGPPGRRPASRDSKTPLGSPRGSVALSVRPRLPVPLDDPGGSPRPSPVAYGPSADGRAGRLACRQGSGAPGPVPRHGVPADGAAPGAQDALRPRPATHDPYRGTVYRPTGRLRGHRAALRPPLATHDPYRGTVVRLRWRLRGHRTALRPPLATHGPHRFPYLGPPGATAKSVAINCVRRLGS